MQDVSDNPLIHSDFEPNEDEDDGWETPPQTDLNDADSPENSDFTKLSTEEVRKLLSEFQATISTLRLENSELRQQLHASKLTLEDQKLMRKERKRTQTERHFLSISTEEDLQEEIKDHKQSIQDLLHQLFRRKTEIETLSQTNSTLKSKVKEQLAEMASSPSENDQSAMLTLKSQSTMRKMTQQSILLQDSQPTNMAVRIVYRGWLRKLGNFRKNWKRRWFMLNNNGDMSYYSDTDARKLCGVIDLSEVASIIKVIDRNNLEAEFILQTESRDWQLRAQSAEERNQWVRVIHKVQDECGIKAAVAKESNAEEFAKLKGKAPASITDENVEMGNLDSDTFLMELTMEEYELVSSEELLPKVVEKLEHGYHVEPVPPHHCNITYLDPLPPSMWAFISKSVRRIINGMAFDSTVHKGYLWKSGKWNSSWKRRFFVLNRDGSLFYFKEEGEETHLGVINLHGIQGMSRIQHKSKQFAFTISTKERKWQLSAESEVDLNLWLADLHKVAVIDGENSENNTKKKSKSLIDFMHREIY